MESGNGWEEAARESQRQDGEEDPFEAEEGCGEEDGADPEGEERRTKSTGEPQAQIGLAFSPSLRSSLACGFRYAVVMHPISSNSRRIVSAFHRARRTSGNTSSTMVVDPCRSTTRYSVRCFSIEQTNGEASVGSVHRIIGPGSLGGKFDAGP